MSKIIVTAVAIVAVLVAPAAASAATPKQAARAAKSCLVRHGWSARLADHGATVDAEAPRVRSGYPHRPWYSVAFSDIGSGTFYSEIRMGLNHTERKLTIRCRNRGLGKAR